MTEQIVNFIKKPSYSRVAKNKVITLRYGLFDLDGEVIEYRDDLEYLHGGYGGAFPKAEEALEGLEVGNKIDINLTAEEGFGESASELIMEVPLEQIPEEGRRVGASIDGEGADGHVVKFRVTELGEQSLVLNGNHPLAGQGFRLMLEVLHIRAASFEEIEKGYAFKSAPQD